MLRPTELFAKLSVMKAHYDDALAAHNLGRAGSVQGDVGTLVCQNWETLLAAMEAFVNPLAHGAEEHTE